MIIPRNRTRNFFPEEDEESWKPRLKQLAELNLPLKSLADSFGCSYQTLSTNDNAMDVVKKGWAFYRARIEMELWLLATEVAAPDADSIEKKSIRDSRGKALAVIHKVLHKDPFIPPIEQERIRRLTEVELQEELKKHLEKPLLGAVNVHR